MKTCIIGGGKPCKWKDEIIDVGIDLAPCALVSSNGWQVGWTGESCGVHCTNKVNTRAACRKQCELDLSQKDVNQVCFWGEETLFDQSKEKRKFQRCSSNTARFSLGIPIGDPPYFPTSKEFCERSIIENELGPVCDGGRVEWGTDVVIAAKEGACARATGAPDLSLLALWEPKKKRLFPFGSSTSKSVWTVTRDRKVLGQITAGSRKQENNVSIPVLSTPDYGKKADLFVLTLSTKPFQDPGDWKRETQTPTPTSIKNLKKAYLQQANPSSYSREEKRTMSVFPTKESWMKPLKTYVSKQGLHLYLVHIDASAFPPRESTGAGDDPSEDYGDRWILEVSAETFRVIPGRDLSLIDIGDYDGDGQYEFIFVGAQKDDYGKPVRQAHVVTFRGVPAGGPIPIPEALTK